MMDVCEQPGTASKGVDLHVVQSIGKEVEEPDAASEKGHVRLPVKFCQADHRLILIPALLHHIPLCMEETGLEIPVGRERVLHGANQGFSIHAIEQGGLRDIVLGSFTILFPVDEDAPLVFRDGIQFLLRIGRELWLRIGTLRICPCSQGADRRPPQNLRHGNMQTKGPVDIPRQAHGPDGGQSETHKVVRHAEFFCSQNPCGNPEKFVLPLRFRRDTLHHGKNARLRQGLPVDLAVWCHGHCGNGHIHRGHHVFRQGFRQEFPQIFLIDPGIFQRGIVKNQLILLHSRCHILNTLKPAGESFDFPHLDAEAPKLHLAIHASQVLQLPCLVVTGQISCTVHFLPRQEGTLHKTPGRYFRFFPVAFGKLVPGQAQFAHCSLGQEMPIGIADERPSVRRRASDGNILILFLVHHMVGGPYGKFRGAIHVDKLYIRPPAWQHFFSPYHQAAKGQFRVLIDQEHADLGRKGGHADLVFDNVFFYIRHVAAQLFGKYMNRAACRNGAEQVVQ